MLSIEIIARHLTESGLLWYTQATFKVTIQSPPNLLYLYVILSEKFLPILCMFFKLHQKKLKLTK
ncbi:MAG: hypothetical protein LBJ00_16080, partial [Planctomycetaceae bacterium]|nr:hypothetical protein [Planctomycetaceae bacterium]